MTILQSLNKAYDRLALRGEVPEFGYSAEKISFCIVLNTDGSVASAPVDLRDASGKKRLPRVVYVPQPVKRTSGIAPNFLWDKSSYVLGVTAGVGKRLEDEHKAFREYHLSILDDIDDEGLLAFRNFISSWEPQSFETLGWPEEIKDQNIVFALDTERRNNIYIHDRPAARILWAGISSEGEKSKATCLISGEKGPIARLHPNIKGVWGGQTGGGSIVSFNLDAFSSYDHEQGNNSPISEKAAFSYTTVLNRLLAKDSKNRIQIGDASTVFWADASEVETSDTAENLFLACFEQVDENAESRDRIRPILEKIRNGETLDRIDPGLSKGVRFYVLGLAPNAARISVRFWFENDFGQLMENYQKFLEDMRVEPPDRDEYPALWKFLRETAVQGKAENIVPNLAGDWMRSILTGTRYPQTLLSTIFMRIRADKTINAKRVSVLKALLIRNFGKEAPMGDNPDFRKKGYQLGRLFSIYEHIQSAALGANINATIRDKFYSSASTQPRKVFTLLDRGSVNHLSKIGKQKPGYRVNLEKEIAGIMDIMSPEDDPFPVALSMEDQALFSLGYYHKRNEFFKSKSSEEPANEPSN